MFVSLTQIERGQRGTYKLVERDLGSLTVEHEPPRVAGHSGETDIRADDHITEEEPLGDQGLTAAPWRNTHDRVVWRVEAQSRSRKTIRDEVDPE